MVRILKLFAYILFFILALVYFIPKVSLYYEVEQVLEKQKIIVSKEEVVEHMFSLELRHAKLSYKAIQSATIEHTDIKLLGFYNTLSVSNVRLSSVVSTFIPIHINTIDMQQTLFNPLNITFEASGEFGTAHGQFNIVDKNLSIVLQPSKLMLRKYRNTLTTFRKTKNKEYKYDQAF